MGPPSSSIQSYFSRSSSPTRFSSPVKYSTPAKAGASAGPTAASSSPAQISPSKWSPQVHYIENDIGDLQPGPQCITFMGRIVNFYDQSTPSKMPKAAKGCIKIIVKDDTGALTVRLWYADRDYDLKLGQLVSVWAPHISDGMNGNLSVSTAPLLVNIFPERDRSCHFMVHDASDTGKQCKIPLGYIEGEALPDLVTLKDYKNGRHEKLDVRILVCVTSMAPRKIRRKKGDGTVDLVDLRVQDDTEVASLTLWGQTASSVMPWIPSTTVLLITNPSLRADSRLAINLAATTYVDIDPAFPDADYVRRHVQSLTKKEHPNLPFPEQVFDLRATLASPIRPLYTLADLDAHIRARPYETFTAFLSVIILSMHIHPLFLRGQLMSTSCCGIPLFGSSPTATCKQCNRVNTLRTNPRVVGDLVDETGVVERGKMVWSQRAWRQLLGRTEKELCGCDGELMRYLERRISGLRVTLVVGWMGGEGEGMGGRLGVLSVMM